jgi:hypothetical protein
LPYVRSESAMASATAGPAPLADRAEIHKSCKSLEAVVNLLNDYCEAASAIVQLQKRLTKAIKEAASAKCVNETAGDYRSPTLDELTYLM